MRKYLLIMSAGCIGWLTTGAQAACPVFPTCEEMGYTMTATDCSGRATLKCPSDHAKVFCIADSSVECQIGSVLYNDLKCYDEAPEGKTALGVVFDTNKRLAISRQVQKNIRWYKAPIGTGTGIVTPADIDISDLDNCGDLGLNYQYCEIDGKSNTQKIVAQLGSDRSDYAAGYCYNLTDGDTPKGSWFLPSASELKTLYDNKATVTTALKTIGGEIIPISGIYCSSNEDSSHYALYLYLSDGGVNRYDKGYTYPVRCAVKY